MGRSDKEGSHRHLEGGDGTVVVWEGGLEVGEDVCGWGPASGNGRELGRRTATQERGADGTLCPVESHPDASEGSVASGALGGVDGGRDGAADGVLKKCPQCACGDAQASDFVGEPDAEGSSAALPPMTVTAKDSACS